MADTLLGQRVDAIRRLARRGHTAPLAKVVAKARAEDIAAVIEHLTATEQRLVFAQVKEERVAADVLSRVHGEELLHLVSELAADRLAGLLSHLAADDQTDLLGRLPEETRAAVLALMKGDAREEVEELLGYAPDSAGGIMSPSAFTLHEGTTCRDAIAAVQRASDHHLVYYAYVESEAGQLVGIVSLRGLLQHPPSTKLGEIMSRDVISVRPEVDQEEVARIASRYDLYAVPVVDAQGHLLGIVTIDDVVDVLREESGEDLLMMAGVRDAEVTLRATVRRLPWLAVPLAGGLVVAELLRFVGAPAGLMLLPALVLLEASVAVQAVALMLRRLGTGRLDGGAVRAVLSEVLRSGLLGLVLAAAAAGYASVRAPAATLSLPLSLTAGLAIAGGLGAGLPVFFRRVGWDPGLATAPAVGTLATVCGVATWVGLVQLLPGP